MSEVRPDAWMPMYWGDYHRDTKHLKTVDHGAYMLLISHYWCSGGPINDDNEEMATIAGLTVKEWLPVRKKLVRLFVVDDGLWHHKRVDFELHKAKRISDARQKAGKRGGKRSAIARANGQAIVPPIAEANGRQTPQQGCDFATSKIQHSHSHSHKEEEPSQEEVVVKRRSGR